MKTRKITLLMVAAFLCGSAGGTAFEYSRVRKLRVEQAAVSRQINLQKADLQQAKTQKLAAEQSARAAEEQCKVAQKQLEEALSKLASTNVSAGVLATQQGKPNVIDQVDLMAIDPEYQRLNLAWQRLRHRTTYGRLYKKLGLTPQQIENFEDLLVARTQASLDVLAAAYSQGISRDDPAFRKLSNPASAEINAKIREVLGEEGYKLFNNYRRLTGGPAANAAIQTLASSLFYTEHPLTVDQANRLTPAIDANSKIVNHQQEVDWDNVYLQTQQILSADQMRVLQSQRESARIDRLMQEIVEKENKVLAGK